MEAAPSLEMTYEEYVAFERNAELKHEFVNGLVYAMSGGTPEHARLAQAIGAALTVALHGKPCAVFSSDLRVRIQATGRSTYPDVAVVCGKLERDATDSDAVTNPRVIVEVLSPSTESSDRGDKWAHYQRLGSLREYVLVSQASPRIEIYSRDEAQSGWLYRHYGLGESAQLPSLESSIGLDAIYANPLT
jgi:Uma2 family endonuclease